MVIPAVSDQSFPSLGLEVILNVSDVTESIPINELRQNRKQENMDEQAMGDDVVKP